MTFMLNEEERLAEFEWDSATLHEMVAQGLSTLMMGREVHFGFFEWWLRKSSDLILERVLLQGTVRDEHGNKSKAHLLPVWLVRRVEQDFHQSSMIFLTYAFSVLSHPMSFKSKAIMVRLHIVCGSIMMAYSLLAIHPRPVSICLPWGYTQQH